MIRYRRYGFLWYYIRSLKGGPRFGRSMTGVAKQLDFHPLTWIHTEGDISLVICPRIASESIREAVEFINSKPPSKRSEGVFVNAKTTDDDIHMNIFGYYIPVKPPQSPG